MSQDAFDPFAHPGNEERPSEVGGWGSSQAGGWGSDINETNFTSGASNMNPAIECQFGAALNEEGINNILEAPSLFPDDPFADEPDATALSDDDTDDHITTVHVSLHEQLTCLYDGNSSVPSGQVEGAVHVQSSNSKPFCLVVHDENDVIATFRSDRKFCKEIKPANKSSFTEKGSRILRVTLPANSSKQLKILTYQCHHKLRPIPLLVKTKVQVAKNHCRLGIKIRSNPENRQSLAQVAIIVAIPPEVQGETVRLSRKGGVWDSMKRIVAWSVDTLPPGELIEIQAQFEFVGKEPQIQSPKFPLVVRCDAPKEQFSTIELSSDFNDKLSSPAKISVVRSVRIMHRKV